MVDHLTFTHVADIIKDSLDDHDLLDIVETCGIEADKLSRTQLIAHLAERFHGDEQVGQALARSLVRVNYDFINQVQSMDIREIRQHLSDADSEWSQYRGRVLFALLADRRPEVNAMAERFLDRQPPSQGGTDEAPPETSGSSTDWVYEELIRELEQARKERAELMGLLKEVRKFLERTNRPAAEPMNQGKALLLGPRVGLFVDVQHIFYNARNFYGRKLDFKKLIEATTRDRNLATAVAYLVLSPEVDQSNFITMLEQNGYTVREKLPRRRNEELNLSEDELPMSLDILKQANGLDVVVLVGADVDILSLSQRIRGSGTKVELYGFPQNTTEEVVRAVDRFCPIDDSLLLPQDYSSRRAVHNGQQRASLSAGRAGTSRGFTGGQQRGWSSDARGS